jgi:hypothetical protein
MNGSGIIHAYDGDVVDTDTQLGLVLDEFDSSKICGQILLLFSLEIHGQHLGEHEGLWKKKYSL